LINSFQAVMDSSTQIQSNSKLEDRTPHKRKLDEEGETYEKQTERKGCLTCLQPKKYQNLEPPKKKAEGTAGVWEKGTRWIPGTRLIVYFMNGTEEQKKNVKEIAPKWLSSRPNIKLNFDKEAKREKAHIRIKFEEGAIPCSAVGSYAQEREMFPIDKPTMVLDPSAKDLKTSILHEFGHAFGFIHEHALDIPAYKFKTNVITKNLEAIGWTKEAIDENCKKVNLDTHETTGPDHQSIMLYWSFDEEMVSGIGLPTNTTLSKKDLESIVKLYS